jgi:hypothetical protein
MFLVVNSTALPQVTLKRAWESLSWMERLHLVYMLGDINNVSITHEDVERMKVRLSSVSVESLNSPALFQDKDEMDELLGIVYIVLIPIY